MKTSVRSVFRVLLVFSLASMAALSSGNADAFLDPALSSFSKQDGTSKKKVIVLLQSPRKNIRLPRRYHRPEIIRYLQGLMKLSIESLRGEISAEMSQSDLQVLNVYWINLSFSATVTSRGLNELLRAPSVKAIYSNKMIRISKPFRGNRSIESRSGQPYNFEQTGLSRLISEAPEVDGRGIIMGHIDTGVDGKHPALQGKVIRFFDGSKVTQPVDADSHGTHTAGTMLGGSRQGELIGVAPGAKLVSAGFLRTLDEVLKGMQWMLDPDGNPQTNDTPRLVSNSWGLVPGDNEEATYRAVGAWEAAGIIAVFSSGNMGPNEGGIGTPGNHPDVISVGATGPNQKIADFSSRGPGMFQGKATQKPDLTGPGVDILSAVPGGGYQSMSGTSMSAPHVAGTIALMLQVNPQLNPSQVKEILKQSSVAVDLNGNPTGTRTWNKFYGLGRLDIYKAVQMARTASFSRVRLNDVFSDLMSPTSIRAFENMDEEEYFELK